MSSVYSNSARELRKNAAASESVQTTGIVPGIGLILRENLNRPVLPIVNASSDPKHRSDQQPCRHSQQGNADQVQQKPITNHVLHLNAT